MAMTPEGQVKQKVRSILARYQRLYYYMPVPSGYGKTSLDFIGCYNSKCFAIETKTEGRPVTARQWFTIAEMELAGAKVFVIAGLRDDACAPLIEWLEQNRPTSHDDPRIPSTQSIDRIL